MTDSQMQLLARRKLLTGALMLAVALPTFGASRARAANAFDGTWAGLDANGETVQMIFVSGEIIGFYWRGDYLDASAVKFDKAGSNLSFTFTGGQAVVNRDAAGMTVTIRDKGGESHIDLKKD
jgi:hypothetical protein